MNKQRTTRAVVIFVGLALAGISMAITGLDQTAESVQAILIALGAAIFGAGLAFFLATSQAALPTLRTRKVDRRPNAKALALFCALAIAGTSMAALSPLAPAASVQTILIPVGASLLSAAVVFFLLEAFSFGYQPTA